MINATRRALPQWQNVALPGIAWVLLGLIVIFSLTAKDFASSANAWNVGTQATLLLLLALPMTLVILTEGLDLSMGAVLSLCTVILASVDIASGSLGLGLGAALAVGITFGVLNGWLVAWMGVTPFVATLGTMGLAQGLALVAIEGRETIGVTAELRSLWEGHWVGLPIPIVGALVAYVLLHVVLYHTRFGARVISLGGNREALRLAGLNVNWYLMLVYVIAGGCVAVSAMLLTARINGGNASAAIGMEFDAIAAVIVGGTSFTSGRGGLLGSLFGVLTVSVLRNGLNLLALQASVQVAAVGLLVIVALAIDARAGKV